MSAGMARALRQVRSLVDRHRRTNRAAGEMDVHVVPGCSDAAPEYSAELVDALYGPDAFFVTEELWELLDHEERQALVAHEIAHEDRIENHLTHFTDSILASTLLAVVIFGVWSLAAGEFRHFFVELLLPYSAVRLPLAVLNSRVSRFAEFLADLRGAVATGKPEAFVRMLEKVERAEASLDQCPRLLLAIVGFFDTHPTTERRREALMSSLD